MCGIQGVINLKEVSSFKLFEETLKLIGHRGPNSIETWKSQESRVYLGSTRLSIQDLGTHANMPFTFENLILVFNGEIYNHSDIRGKLKRNGYTFNTRSDTEVVIKAFHYWGVNCFSMFSGMFALIIHDKVKCKTIISRDIAGEKPLFYAKTKSQVIIGSELKQILRLRQTNEICEKGLVDFLSNGYNSPQKTLIKGVDKLNPGSFAIISEENDQLNFKQKDYYKLPPPDKINFDFNYHIEKLGTLLNQNTRLQLHSDVPIGVLLSGGIDSSLVAYYASRNSARRIKTFNIGIKNNQKLDESKFAKKVSNFIDSEHYTLDAEEIDLEFVIKVLEEVDEPLGDSSILPTYLVSKLVKNFVTVALGGDGGDELFGGYSSYKQALNFNRTYSILRKPVSKPLNIAASKLLPVGFKGRNFLQSLSDNPRGRFSKNRIFQPYDIKLLLNYPVNFEKFKDENLIPGSEDLIQDLCRSDFKNYLREDILVKTDRTSMVHSVELRSPFLSKNIINYAFSEVPSQYKTSKNQTKILPLQLAKTLYANQIDFNRKQGFSIPFGDILTKAENQMILRNILNTNQDFLDCQFMNQLLDWQSAGYRNDSRLFTLLSFLVWYNKNKQFLN